MDRISGKCGRWRGDRPVGDDGSRGVGETRREKARGCLMIPTPCRGDEKSRHKRAGICNRTPYEVKISVGEAL